MQERPNRGPAGWLALAAAPSFALMGLLTALLGDEVPALCTQADHSSMLGGMTAMYLLMTVFHLGPWLGLGRSSAG